MKKGGGPSRRRSSDCSQAFCLWESLCIDGARAANNPRDAPDRNYFNWSAGRFAQFPFGIAAFVDYRDLGLSDAGTLLLEDFDLQKTFTWGGIYGAR
jgi:hypothetical protein